MTAPIDCYIALGSNEDDPQAQLQRALAALSRLPESRLLHRSSFYRSAPMGPQDQDDFINAVACVATRMSPIELLDALQAIEREQGRIREGRLRWGPRPLDLDLILYGNQVYRDERLEIPHPGVFQRNFVLYPLHEIRPDLVFPGGERLAELVEQSPSDGLERMENN